MSTKAVSWVLHQVRVEPITKMILVTLAENADEYGVAWPSQTTMARSACVSVITVKRKMKVLEAAGVLSVRRNRVGKNKTKNKYRLHLEKSFDLMPESTVSPSSEAELDPDFEGIQEIPLNEQPKQIESISEIPLKVSERDQRSAEGISGETFKGISCDTRTTSKPPLTPSNNITTTEEHPVFSNTNIDKRSKITISLDWRPSDHVFDQLLMTRGIDREFAEAQIPGFVIYHNGASNRQGAFDSSFLKHVIYNSENQKTKPKPLPWDWQPDQATIQKLHAEGLGTDFIWDAATSFAMYWSERKEARHSWNSQFFQSCLSHYRKLSQGTGLAVSQQSTLERFTDRTWAE